jgi:hypothetical protein
MATWFCPGPRFWTLKPATLAATASRFSAPRSRSTVALGAAIEKGTSSRVSSRSVAVTTTCCSGRVSSEKSTVASPVSCTSGRATRR